MNPNAVLLVEDHPLVSMMLADMLTEHAPDMGVIKVPTIQACEQHVHENPRLVIFDLNLPDCMGVDSAKRVRDLFPFAQLLAFTGTAHDNILQELSDMDIPCVRKSADYHELLDAVTKGLMATGISCQEGMNADKIKSKNEFQSNIIAPGSKKPLTWRQVEIMRRIAVGMTAKEAARDMNLSPETVRAHMREVLVRLGAQNRAHAVSIFTKAERQSRLLEEAQSN
ncbi:MAG: response regulator transcription factor [Burkholderiales bacterium]|jgi:DNA-binding NarL/FixJ family response regulator|uniref:response regulator transcription factor n=1 Tax=Limnobacter sp. TaxID=2003368 RepID=UPI00394267F2|nr:response regulator transcription factor [Burkholderiales bacterium]